MCFPALHIRSLLLLAVFSLWLPAPAPALILDAGDGMGNTTAPDDDPGWQNVGLHLGSPSVVYLGNRWILTANHVGASIVTLEGKRYDPVAGSLVQLQNPDETQADLLLFQIDDDPGLPALTIKASAPPIGEHVILISAGSSRSERVTVISDDRGPIDGFLWQKDQTKRWGTNIVHGEPRPIEHIDTVTMAVPIVFDRIEDRLGTRQEAVAAKGDSGGAVFSRADPLDPESSWTLSGILFSVASQTGRPTKSSFYGDVTWAADLSHYRNQILETIGLEPPTAELPAKAKVSDSAEAALPIPLLAVLVLSLFAGLAAWKASRRGRQSDR